MHQVPQNNYKVRIFLGPNGSGKSSIYSVLTNKFKFSCGTYINADEIEKSIIRGNGFKLDKSLKAIVVANELINFIRKHPINKKCSLIKICDSLKVEDGIIKSDSKLFNSYHGAAIADYLRRKLMECKINFSFESVFSDKGKIEFVKQLYKSGYKIYFYVVATINPAINIKRISDRVKANGHNVSEEKIVERFNKSLVNIKASLQYTHRCFIIDNSQDFSPVLVAELENGKKLVYLDKEYLPNWVKNII